MWSIRGQEWRSSLVPVGHWLVKAYCKWYIISTSTVSLKKSKSSLRKVGNLPSSQRSYHLYQGVGGLLANSMYGTACLLGEKVNKELQALQWSVKRSLKKAAFAKLLPTVTWLLTSNSLVYSIYRENEINSIPRIEMIYVHVSEYCQHNSIHRIFIISI